MTTLERQKCRDASYYVPCESTQERREVPEWPHSSDRYGFFYVPTTEKKRKRKVRRRSRGATQATAIQVSVLRQLKIISHAKVDADATVLRMTKSIFAGPITMESVTDPESGVVSTQVCVEAAGNVDELLALNDRWHRELANLGDIGTNYCLSLVPSDEPN